jgi:hypothetical protein
MSQDLLKLYVICVECEFDSLAIKNTNVELGSINYRSCPCNIRHVVHVASYCYFYFWYTFTSTAKVNNFIMYCTQICLCISTTLPFEFGY